MFSDKRVTGSVQLPFQTGNLLIPGSKGFRSGEQTVRTDRFAETVHGKEKGNKRGVQTGHFRHIRRGIVFQRFGAGGDHGGDFPQGGGTVGPPGFFQLPDQFPLAESHGYIHVLTEIILHKTCKEIGRLTEEGYQIARISVNVSVLELKDDDFCGDINHIIQSNSIDGGKIAIELTESGSEADFILMKEKIEQLRGQGIQFYLDDFGTGYSNMERIMELPFDIIKFDRSLVIASGVGERSERIVENLAHMFRDMEYSVLYEGVEDEGDEARCRGMSASYLQGYKYSRPVPIERLRNFLPKAG